MPLMILSTQKYKMGTGKLSGKPDEMRGGNLAMELASHPEGRGGEEGGGEEGGGEEGGGEEGGGEEGGGEEGGGKREGGEEGGGEEGGGKREGGSSNTPNCFMLHRNWDKLQLDG